MKDEKGQFGHLYVQRLWFFFVQEQKTSWRIFWRFVQSWIPQSTATYSLSPKAFSSSCGGDFVPHCTNFPHPPFPPPPSTAQTLVPTRNKCSPFHSIQTAKSRQLWDRWERRKESGSIKPPLPPRSTAGFWVLPKRHELVLSTHSHIHTHQPTRTLTHERKVSSFSDGLVLILRPYNNYNNGYNSRLSEEKI